MTAAATKPKKLAVVQVSIDRIEKNPWNPNRMNELTLQAERESIQRFGFIDPVTVRKHPDKADWFQIIDGEHRWRIAGEEGYTTVPVIVLDVTEEEAKKLTVVLNETRGDADVVLLGKLLADLQELPDFKVGLAFTDGDLAHLLNLGQEDWDRFTADPPGGGLPPPAETHEIVVTLDAQHYEQFNTWLKIIEKENGLSGQGVSAIVYDTVRRVAHAANQGT